MKIKIDYVTNSSSCCFVIKSPQKLTQKEFHDKGFCATFNEFTSIANLKQLITYTDCEECDWVKLPMGPHKFWGLPKEEYEKAKLVIEGGDSITFVHVERDPDDVSIFDRILTEMNCEVLKREYD